MCLTCFFSCHIYAAFALSGEEECLLLLLQQKKNKSLNIIGQYGYWCLRFYFSCSMLSSMTVQQLSTSHSTHRIGLPCSNFSKPAPFWLGPNRYQKLAGWLYCTPPGPTDCNDAVPHCFYFTTLCVGMSDFGFVQLLLPGTLFVLDANLLSPPNVSRRNGRRSNILLKALHPDSPACNRTLPSSHIPLFKSLRSTTSALQ